MSIFGRTSLFLEGRCIENGTRIVLVVGEAFLGYLETCEKKVELDAAPLLFYWIIPLLPVIEENKF